VTVIPIPNSKLRKRDFATASEFGYFVEFWRIGVIPVTRQQ
jgi:hypothetical protein